MIRGKSIAKPKTKFQQFSLMIPTLTQIKPFKKKEIKSKTIKGNKNRIARSIFPQIKTSISQSIIMNPSKEKKVNPTLIIPSSGKATKNLYKNVIEYNLINHIKKQEESKEKHFKTKSKLNIPLPNKKYKIDFNKQVKNMIPKIDDLEEFTNDIQRKHKGLFEKIIPLLFKQKPISFKQNKEFEVPLLLYEDYKFFIKRFYPHKYIIKSMPFADSNMIYPSLIDYNSYIKKFKEYLTYFKQDKFTENAFNFDNGFYLKLLKRLTNNGNKTKIVSMNIKDNDDLDKDRLHEKKDYNNVNERKMNNDNNSKSDDEDENNDIRSILKKKMNEEGKKKRKVDTIALANEDDRHNNKYREGKNDKENQFKMYHPVNETENELNYSSSDNEEFFELLSKANSKMSNSYLDNSYIFETNTNEKENRMKFSVRIMKNIQLDEKKVASLYDKYFSKMKQREIQRSYDL